MSTLNNVSAPEVDNLLLSAHEAMAKLKRFVAQEEMAKLQDHHHADGGGRARPDMPPPHLHREAIFDAVMQWVRTTVNDARTGFLLPWSDDDATSTMAPGSDESQDRSMASVSFLIRALTDQLEHDRKTKQFAAATMVPFNETLNGYREENRSIAAYRDRIIELQAVINHTKRYSDIDTEVGAAAKPRLVPSDCVPSEEQRRREVANELARVTVSLKDKLDRTEADNLKLSSDRMLLTAENKLLLDRVRVLEAQLTVLNASSAVALRELSKARAENARLASPLLTEGPTGPAHVSRYAQRPTAEQTTTGAVLTPVSSGGPGTSRDIEIGGLLINRDVARWIVDVYKALLENPEAADKLQHLRMSSAGQHSNTGSNAGMPRRSAPSSATSGGGGGDAGRGAENAVGQRTSSARSFSDHVNAVRVSSAATTRASQSDVDS